MAPDPSLTRVALLALAVAAGSVTVTKSRLFGRFRVAVLRRSEVLGELVTCAYCFSHWVAAAALAGTGERARGFGGPVADALVTWLAVIALAAVAVRFMEWPRAKA